MEEGLGGSCSPERYTEALTPGTCGCSLFCRYHPGMGRTGVGGPLNTHGRCPCETRTDLQGEGSHVMTKAEAGAV